MRLKKMICRLSLAVFASVTLLGSVTVFAADKPAKADNPTWGDVYSIMDYVGEMVYERVDAGELEFVDDVETESHYRAPGTLLVSAPKEQAYAAYVEGNGAFANAESDGQETLPEDKKNDYNSFYDAGISFVSSITTADGTKYTDDIMSQYDSFWTDKDAPLWKKVEGGQIISVASEEDAPDAATMSKGTYWILEADLEAYNNAIQSAIEKSDKWRKGNEPTRAEVQECINIVTNAYNALLDKLHEGTKKTETATESLSPADSAPVSSSSGSQTEEVIPEIVNEVMFSAGTKVQSNLKGVYGSNFVKGCIYSDELTKINQAAGLTETETKSGVVIKYYICKSLNKTMNAMLSKTVSEQGYKLLGVMNNDLYKLDHGNISKIKTTNEELAIVLGIPENLRNEQYEFVIMCYDEGGKLVVMPDIDNDKATITVRALNFGYWAIGYRSK